MYELLLYRGESFDPNFYYQSGLDIDHAFLLLKRNEKILFVPRLNEEFAKTHFDGHVEVYQNPFEVLKKYLRGKTISVDSSSLTHALSKRLKSFCKIEDASSKLAAMRLVKKEKEIKKITRAVSITKKILSALDFSKMKTELDVKRYLLQKTLEYNCEAAFEPIVATDTNSRFPHYRSGNVKLGDMVLIDYGVKYEHYCADLTRCFFIGNSKINREREDKYESLKEITKTIVSSLPKLKTGKTVAKLSVQLLKENGFPPLIHAIGHGIGLEVHEAPRLGLLSKNKIAGSALAIEPAAYFKDYGLRFEETVYFDGKKGRIL